MALKVISFVQWYPKVCEAGKKIRKMFVNTRIAQDREPCDACDGYIVECSKEGVVIRAVQCEFCKSARRERSEATA